MPWQGGLVVVCRVPRRRCAGWLHHGQLEADAGPLCTLTCPQVTGATCLSAESQGRPVPAHLHGSWLLCLPPRLPGTSLESLPVTSPDTFLWLSAISWRRLRCHRNRCLCHTVLKGVSFLLSFLGIPVPGMPMVMLSHHHPPREHHLQLCLEHWSVTLTHPC